MRTIAIVGSGGHARVIVDLINGLDMYIIVGFYDHNPNAKLYGFTHLGNPDNMDGSIESFVIGVGDDRTRRTIFENNKALNWATLIHPSAIVSSNAIIGDGSVICAGSIIQTDVEVGRQCIMNTGCSIDHECTISDFCSICPKATLCGQIQIGTLSFIGANATIVQCITIGDRCTIGAGSVVIRNVGNNCKVVGNPGRTI
jgi:sugar O-acyltransferase (sialic acid O-acetyltransferase NeuD family)